MPLPIGRHLGRATCGPTDRLTPREVNLRPADRKLTDRTINRAINYPARLKEILSRLNLFLLLSSINRLMLLTGRSMPSTSRAMQLTKVAQAP